MQLGRQGRRWRRGLAVLVVLVLAAGACSKDEDDPEPTTSPPDGTSTTTAAGPTFPLTGLPTDDEARRTRPALVAKIDNNEGARPPVGINQADVVYEEEIEGGFTRFAAIFHSQDADPVGPIRSARISDVELLSNLNHPMLAWSGANPTTAGAIRGGDFVDVGFDAQFDEYARADNRPAPSNLFTNTSALYEHAGDARFAPSLFQYRAGTETQADTAAEDAASTTTAPIATTAAPGGPPSTVAPGQPAQNAPANAVPAAGGRVVYRSRDIAYVWDATRGGWLRFQDGRPYADDQGEIVAPENVIFLYIDYLCCPSVAGTPDAQTTGEGDAAVFTNGGLIEAHWSRPTPQDIFTLTDVNGAPVLLTPGRTWVELANPDTGSVIEQAEASQLLDLATQPIQSELPTPQF